MAKREFPIFSVGGLSGVPEVNMVERLFNNRKRSNGNKRTPTSDVKTRNSCVSSYPGKGCDHKEIKKIGDNTFRCLECGWEYIES